MNKCKKVDCIHYSNNLQCGLNKNECKNHSKYSSYGYHNYDEIVQRFLECEEELQQVKRQRAELKNQNEELKKRWSVALDEITILGKTNSDLKFELAELKANGIFPKFKIRQEVCCIRKSKDKRCECCNQTLFNNDYEIRTDIPYIVDIDINISNHYNGVDKPLIPKAIIQYHLSNELGWECQEDFYNVDEKYVFATQAEAEAKLEKMRKEKE